MPRLPLRASLLSRPTYLLFVILPFALLLLLSKASVSDLNPSYHYQRYGVDARVGWSSEQEDGHVGFAGKAGQALTGFGDRIGRLAGGKPPAKSKSAQSASAGKSGSFRSIFQRTGGSLYELVNLSPPSLYDARTSLDKLRLASTRFTASPPPSPYAVFSKSTRREHILVTGGFSALGRSLVRDLLLLGESNGVEEASQKAAQGINAFGLKDWLGADDDEQDSEEQAARLAKSLEGKTGLIVTILDITNRSLELDDMLRHAPLYHRSRVGFGLPLDDPGPDAFRPEGRVDPGTPPLEFIDPRSAAFSSSQVSLASFIAKGRLRFVKGDVRNTSLITTLLNPRLAAKEASDRKFRETPVKSKFGIPKRPHHDTDEADMLPPISGVFHLAGYENAACRLAQPRDCADLERNGVAALAHAMHTTDEASRPWLVLADRGNLAYENVRAWLADDATEQPILGVQTRVPAAASTSAVIEQMIQRSYDNATPQRKHARRSYFGVPDYASPLASCAREQKLHALSLRIPPDTHMFGDSFASRVESPVSHLVHSAVGHTPILVNDNAFPDMHVPEAISNSSDPSKIDGPSPGPDQRGLWQNMGLAYIDDIVESMLAAGELLARSNTAEYLRRTSILAEVDIVPPQASVSAGNAVISASSSSFAQEAVDWIVQLTRSSSPVGIVRRQASLAGDAPLLGKPLDRSLANRVLGTTPSTPLPLALKAYIRSLLGRQTTYLDSQIGVACAPPPDLRTLNDALAQLHLYTVQMLGLVSAENIVLACNSDYLGDRTKAPLVLRDPYTTADGLSQVKLKSRWGPVGKVDVGFYCPFGKDGADEQIFWTESTKAVVGSWATATDQARLALEDSTLWTYDKFEVNFVRRDTRSFTLSIPQYPQANVESPKRRMVFTIDHSKKGSEGGMKDMVMLNWQLLGDTGPDWQTMEWRLNPISCKERKAEAVNGFSFLGEDPLYTSQILYPSADGSTTVADSTYDIQRCRDLRLAHDYTAKVSLWNERTSIARACPRSMSEGSDWFVHDLPICNIDCNAPVTCLINDKCRCARNVCGEEPGLSPNNGSTQDRDDLSFSYAESHNLDKPAVKDLTPDRTAPSLQALVNDLPWDRVIRPEARQLFSLPLSALPGGHILDLPHDIDDHMTEPACYDLSKSEVPTMADHFLVQAFSQRAAAIEDAEFAVIPYYQGCYYNYLKHNTYKKLADTVSYAETQITFSEQLRASNIVVPFLHDWGSCTGWWPDIEEVLTRTPPPPMSKAISWQVNGDLNTRCVKAERDVVVPAATKYAPQLFAKFGNISDVPRSSDRKHLAFFKGEVKGFGSFARSRLEAVAATTAKGNNRILYQEHAAGGDYLETLGQSKFCLLPRGVAGWSSRAFEAIYAGCVPVFIADRTSHPFNNILSYSAFSLSIAENAIHTLPETLLKISNHEMDRMQVALLKVRDAFIYVDDPAKEWTRRGPVYFTSVSMAEKLALEWPTLPVHENCRK